MPGYIATRSLLIIRHIARHPARYATIAIAGILVSLSLLLSAFEKPYGGSYATYASAVKAVIILLLSGFDVDTPASTGGLLCAYAMLVVGLCYVTTMTGLIAVGLLENRLRHGISDRRVKVKEHILLCGWLGRSDEVLKQLFAEDLHNTRYVVIVDPEITAAPLDHPLLKVIKGDPTQKAVLEKANVGAAHSAIILADRRVGQGDHSDGRSLLIALAVETANPAVYTCVEVLNPDNIPHFERVKVDEIISVSEITDHLVVQAALFPGSAQLISDILRFDDGDELYSVPVPAAFIGRTFAQLAGELMTRSDILLFGVRTARNGSSPDGEHLRRATAIVQKNRNRHVLKRDDILYVLAPDRVDTLEELLG